MSMKGITKKAFLKYIKDAQGNDYIKEQGYKTWKFRELIRFEENHYEDFKHELIFLNSKKSV